jgi:hypothetical protein
LGVSLETQRAGDNRPATNESFPAGNNSSDACDGTRAPRRVQTLPGIFVGSYPFHHVLHLLLERWYTGPSTAVPPERIGRIAPTRTKGINLRGVSRFPIEQFAEQLRATLVATKSPAAGV